jgi:hypothetical protein
VAIGLEARHTAMEIARGIANRSDRACGAYEIVGPMTVEVVWTVEGRRGEEVALNLSERRRLEIDSEGRMRLTRQVVFLAPNGREGEREREWRVVDGHLYVRDRNLPFTRRPIDIEESAELQRNATEVFDSLVRATGDDWSAIDSTPIGYQLLVGERAGGAGRVRCGGEARQNPWLTNLSAFAHVTRARATVTYGADRERPQERSGHWEFGRRGDGPGPTMRVEVRETVEAGPISAPIEAPEEAAAVERVRLHAHLNDFLADVVAPETLMR